MTLTGNLEQTESRQKFFSAGLLQCAGHGALLAGESPASTYLPVRVEKRKRTYDRKGVRERSVYQSSGPTNRNRIYGCGGGRGRCCVLTQQADVAKAVNQEIIREQMNESEVLGLIRKFLKAGVMENGVKQKTEEGTPQGGPLSPLLANIYLDKFDKELEQRGLRFVRYADDCIIFTKSEKAAHRVMASVISWLKRKLFLTASAEKTRVVRPTKGKFLGFTFWKGSDGWKCRPHDDSKKRLKEKIRSVTVRRKAAAIPLAVTFTRINQIMRGWINYYRIGAMSMWLKETFGPWMRHRVRVVILKQWKHRGTIFTNLWKLNGRISHPFPKSYVFAQSMTHCGWYRLGNNEVVNMILNPHILSLKRKDRPGLVDPWKYYSCA